MSANFERLLEWYRRKMSCEETASGRGKIESVAILGAGLMGIEIAAANVWSGVRVALTDTNRQTLDAAPARIEGELKKYEQRGKEAERIPSPAEPNTKLDLLELTRDDERLAGCDLILETVIENLAVKQAVYGRLEPRMAEGAFLATNTSTIPIGDLAAGLTKPGQFCGIHFCHPVCINPLIEIIPGPRTDPTTISAAVNYAKMLGKMPIVVEDGPGFLVNRLLLRYTDEAMHLLLDGADIEQVDRAATEFGMALGPLRILDEIGLDTSLAAGRVLLDAFPERVARLPLLPLLVKRKQLGQKSGGGFYRYAPSPALPSEENIFGESLGPNPEAQSIIEHYAKRGTPPSDELILQRLLLAMVLEATLILEEKKQLDPREIDLSMICGLGFPADKGGLLHWADTVGLSKILETTADFAPLGKRFEPTAMLKELVRSKSRFYE